MVKIGFFIALITIATLAHSPLRAVAEGLRQTMVNYIAAAPQDYLAHPRFWAPFIIADDGAVRPLDDTGATILDCWQANKAIIPAHHHIFRPTPEP